MKVNYDLSKILKPYKKGWVAMNRQQTKVLAHAHTFETINEKIKGYDLKKIVLCPLGHSRAYFVGFQHG